MKKWLWITLIALTVLIAAVLAASFLAGEPLRRYAEQQLNENLPGFNVSIKKLSIQPLTLSVHLNNIVVRQRLHQDRPVATLRRVTGSVRWPALLTARIVLEAEVSEPKIFIDFEQLKNVLEEWKKKARPEAKEMPWQDKLASLPRFTIAEIRVRNGEAAFVGGKDQEALTASQIDFAVRNIKNTRAQGDPAYPSEISMESVLPGSGTLRVSGEADLLRKPAAALRADVELQKFGLAALKGIAGRSHVVVGSGFVSATCVFELSQEGAVFVIKEAVVNEPAVDFVYSGPAAKEKAKGAEAKTREKAKEIVNKPGLLVKANRIRITGGNFGVVNKAAKPEYRVFFSSLDLMITNFSNHFKEGPAELHMRGQFMGSGDTNVSAIFRPEKQGPDFTVRTAVKDTNMAAMNDLFRAYGKFDVTKGLFSVYSEMSAGNRKIKGYVKPLFRDVKVYDKRTDEEKGAFKKLYEKILGGAVKLLENLPRDEVATETPIEGSIEKPDASTWEVLENLVQNAFFKAILPGFERSIAQSGK